MKIVLTNGCFDILHVGHVRLLNWAKAQGDFLIVALNSDESIRKLKGKDRPFNKELDRLEVLHSIRYIDHIIMYNEKTLENILKTREFDIYVKGGDYNLETMNQKERKIIERKKKEIKFFDKIEGYSSTKSIEFLKKTI